jgi:hypothetical protein
MVVALTSHENMKKLHVVYTMVNKHTLQGNGWRQSLKLNDLDARIMLCVGNDYGGY